MLGGNRRVKINREWFRALLNLEDAASRHRAIEHILDAGAGRFYASRMVGVLTPGARYYQIGRLWKVAFSYEQKLAAMDSVVKLDPERALGGLIVALGNDDSTLQRAAIWLIGQLGDPEADRVLVTILEDHRQEIRHAVMQALGHRWHEPQIARLANPHGSVVAEAAAWLAARGESRTVPVLTAVLKDQRRGMDNHTWAQIAIIRALGGLGGRFPEACAATAIAELRAILDRKPGSALCQEAIDALDAIGTDDARAMAIVYTSTHLTRVEL